TGIAPHGPYVELGNIVQKGGKTVFAWGFAGDLDGPIRSNTFRMEWPPRSGTMRDFPEVDRAEFFGLDAGHAKIKAAQCALLPRLAAALRGGRASGRRAGEVNCRRPRPAPARRAAPPATPRRAGCARTRGRSVRCDRRSTPATRPAPRR